MHLEQFDVGAANPTLNRNHIHKLKIRYPKYQIQVNIASILSAYDYLIENTYKRIKLLEQIVKTIYDEWFIKYHYPDHEKDRMVTHKEFGIIPEGWEVWNLSNFGKVITGKTPSKKIPDYFGGEIPFIKTPDMIGNLFVVKTNDSLTNYGVNTQKNKTLPENTLCVSCIGSVGFVSIVDRPSQTNQQINSIVLRDTIYREFLYFCLCDLKNLLQRIGYTGATMLNVSKGKFENIKVINPDKKIITLFHNITGPIFDNIKTLQKKNNLLIKIRDILLLRLVSGEIDVSNFNIEIKEIAF